MGQLEREREKLKVILMPQIFKRLEFVTDANVKIRGVFDVPIWRALQCFQEHSLHAIVSNITHDRID